MSEKDKDKFLELARKRAKSAADAWDDNFTVMDADIDFIAGKQWDAKTKSERDLDGRPYLTFNKLAAIIDQIVGDYRQARISIGVYPAQGDIKGANAKLKNYAGKKDYSLAEVYAGIIRNIEYSSNADFAYDTAFEQCSGHGLGYFRVMTDYLDGDTFDQDFIIKRIRNYKSVLLDPDFQEPDGSDSRYGFLFTKMLKTEFEAKYPDKTPASVSATPDDAYELWVDGDYVLIAEYYFLEEVDRELLQLSNGEVVDGEKAAPILDEMAADGITVVKRRKTKKTICKWAKITADDYIEEPRETVFEYIPIFPVLGKELVVDGSPVYRGAIRHALDAQKMYNFSRSADIERTAQTPKVPFIVSDRQIAGYEDIWKRANESNLAYLPYKETSAPKPSREPPVSTNPGEVNQAMLASDDIKATTGMFDPSMGNTSNASSGKQELVLQQKGDRGNYAFADNLTRSIRHLGRVLIKAIPKVYDTRRVLRLRFADDKEDFVEINKTIVDEQTGRPILVHDLGIGRFDIVAKAAPSYATQRMAALDSMTQLLQAAPELWKIIGDLIAKNMDWPGADEFAKRLQKLLPPELQEKNDDEPTPPPPPPTPDQEAAMATAKAKMATAQATETKAQADIAQANLQFAQIEAQIAQMPKVIHQTVMSALMELMNAPANAPPPMDNGPPMQ